MNKEEIKKIVASLLNKGISLSDIQKQLQSEYQLRMTFLDLRLIASEIEAVDWSKQKSEIEAKKAEEKAKEEAEKKALENNEERAETEGKTIVEISKLTRPGAIANGSVKFASGAKADWILDQYGRLGLDKPEGEPTQEDIKEFQTELQKLVSRGR